MSDNIGPKELSNAFKYLLAYQLNSIASDGVMPSAHGALHKLLCSCYSKNTEVVDIYDIPGDTQEAEYTKRAIEGPENNNKTPSISFPPTSSSPGAVVSTLPTSPSPSELKTRQGGRRKEDGREEKKIEENSSPIIVEVYDDTPKVS
uniref:Uncharacterized protein n=1 Tax=Caenorhabditis tropicalis TaxID=1561998 RepID=A0A1I7U5B3_9PELO